MGMLWGNPSTKMTGLGSGFQSGENKYMMLEFLEEYVLASPEEAYEYT